MISTGHAALELAPDIYISHYPAHEVDHSPEEFARLLRATPENDVTGRFQPSYAFELADWCPADAHVAFHTYDAAKLRAHWDAYRADDTYNLTNRNCSVTVAAGARGGARGHARQRRGVGALLRPDGRSRPVDRGAAAGARRVGDLDARPGARLRARAARDRRAAAEPVAPAAAAGPAAPAAPARRHGEAAGMTAPAAAPAAGGHLLSLAAVIATAAVFGLTYSSSAALIALDLAERGARNP